MELEVILAVMVISAAVILGELGGNRTGLLGGGFPLSVYGAYFLINGLASQNFLCPTAALEEGVDEQETQRNPIDNHRYTVISASGDGT